ncbi:ABC transporter ATP-binding protein NatA [Collinsella sp. AK_207A]|uniref:ATP-binding cassette domain-containing protein n=1 Tax=Collinsella sp. AK_207A TaxID=2650472 RepID=UPI0012605F86|nr:ABC transporter ATP-binding protein [Collinsella sp. AK_207A]VWL86160.1 ABC transporter ATP-binding protein NatA [Collinsella sp. AK_207A]
MLAFSDLTVRVGTRELLSRVSGEVVPGRVRALVAPNGSGKTTLMRALIAADDIRRSGEIAADGVPLEDAAAYRKLVFYVPGDASILYPLLTVRENLDIVKRCWGSPVDILRLAERCKIDSFLGKRVRFLSLGMRQQVALAVGYLTGARYLLLDEPMNALDPTNLEVNSEIVRSLCGDGVGVLMSSHILGNVDDLADDVLFIKGGKLVSDPGTRRGSAIVYKELFG